MHLDSRPEFWATVKDLGGSLLIGPLTMRNFEMLYADVSATELQVNNRVLCKPGYDEEGFPIFLDSAWTLVPLVKRPFTESVDWDVPATATPLADLRRVHLNLRPAQSPDDEPDEPVN